MESFENGDSLYSCGRAKTEAFKYDDVMPRFKARSSAHTIRKRYVWTQMFLNTEKKTSVFENTRLRVNGQIRFKNATCGRRLFLNTEEKISIFENTRLSVDEALKSSESKFSDEKMIQIVVTPYKSICHEKIWRRILASFDKSQ